MTDVKSPKKVDASEPNGDLAPKPEDANLVKSHMNYIKKSLEAIPNFSFSADGSGDANRNFTGRCRLFFGNLPPMLTEEQFIELVKPFGEYEGLFLQAKKGFGFVKLETRAAADICKAMLDGNLYYGKPIRVRFATQSAALLVKHLPSHCTNELLEKAFSQFGEVERSVVIVDDRGKSTGNGIVEFSNKPSFTQAIDAVAAGVFFLTKALRPIEVEPLEQKDEEDGRPAKYVASTPEGTEELSVAPRFANVGSVDYEIGMRWKKLDQAERVKRAKLEEELVEMNSELEQEITNIIADQKTAVLRADFEKRHAELKALEVQQEKKRRELEALAKEVAGVKSPPIIAKSTTSPAAQKNVQLKTTPVKSIPSLTANKTNTKSTPMSQPPRPNVRLTSPSDLRNRIGTPRGNSPRMSTPKATIITHQVAPKPRYQASVKMNMGQQQQQNMNDQMQVQNALRAMSNINSMNSSMNSGMNSGIQRNSMSDMNPMRMNSASNQQSMMGRMGMNNQMSGGMGSGMGSGMGGGMSRPALLQGQPQRGALLNRPALLQQPNPNQMMNNMLRQQMMQARASSPNMGGGPSNKRFRSF